MSGFLETTGDFLDIFFNPSAYEQKRAYELALDDRRTYAISRDTLAKTRDTILGIPIFADNNILGIAFGKHRELSSIVSSYYDSIILFIKEDKQIVRKYVYGNKDAFRWNSFNDGEYISYDIQTVFLSLLPLLPACRYYEDDNIVHFVYIREYTDLYIRSNELDTLTRRENHFLINSVNAWNSISTTQTQFYGQEGFTVWNSYVQDISRKLYHRNTANKAEKRLKAIEQSGLKGEKDVEYSLSWLDDSILIVNRDCINRYGHNSILLRGTNGRVQEFDHLVIGKKNIYHIETKNYKGNITIDSNGNWIREFTDGTKKGERNPAEQIDHHHQILAQILTGNVSNRHIVDIICIANKKTIVNESKNSKYPVIKSDALKQFIEDKEKSLGMFGKSLDQETILGIIESRKVNQQCNPGY